MMATFMFMMVPRAEVCAERIEEVLGTETSVVAPAQPVDTLAGHGRLTSSGSSSAIPAPSIRCCATSTSWRGRRRSPPVDRQHRQRQDDAAQPRPRLMDATGGAVLVDGVPVTDLDPSVLSQASVAIGAAAAVPVHRHDRQQPALRQPRRDGRRACARARGAQARDFVAGTRRGLETPIAQGGTNLVRRQRQRIAIARALMHRPEIYLFDDSFSALDYATDAALRAAPGPRDRRRDGRHRRAAGQHDPQRRPDHLLDDGRVVGVGTHRS
jgi:ATP-binding cassette subfamily B protein